MQQGDRVTSPWNFSSWDSKGYCCVGHIAGSLFDSERLGQTNKPHTVPSAQCWASKQRSCSDKGSGLRQHGLGVVGKKLWGKRKKCKSWMVAESMKRGDAVAQNMWWWMEATQLVHVNNTGSNTCAKASIHEWSVRQQGAWWWLQQQDCVLALTSRLEGLRLQKKEGVKRPS